MTVLSIDHISFSYDDTTSVVADVSFDLAEGEFLSVVGPNGSGKTTLLRLMDRILLPSRGTLTLNNRDITSYSRKELARHIAFVPQESGTLFPFTALEIVLMGRSPYSRGIAFENEHDRAIALEMMKRTDVARFAEKPVTALSGGERQRVFIARALAQQPQIILLDEPNAHLDIAHQVEAFSIIKEMNAHSGLTVVSVSHDLNLAAAYSSRVGIMANGSLLGMGKPEEVLTEPLIEQVFHTEVLVDRHPRCQTPRITLLTP